MSGLPFAGGGFFGSGGKVQTTQATTDTNAATGQAQADRGSQSIAGFQLRDSASVTLTDLGAVQRAFDFSEGAFKAALAASNDSSARAAAAFQSAQSSTAGAFQSAQGLAGAVNADQLVKWGLAAGVLVVIAFLYTGSR